MAHRAERVTLYDVAIGKPVNVRVVITKKVLGRSWSLLLTQGTEVMFIQWDDTYSINVAKVDQQHQRLFELINELHTAVTKSRVQPETTTVVRELATMATVLSELMDYTSDHFSTEENYMVTHAYPEYDVHRIAHGRFTERVQAFQRDFDDGRALRSMEIVEFIKDWWQRHILVVDKKLGVFLNEKGQT